MYTDANQASTIPHIRIHKIQAAEGKTRFWPSCRDVVCVGRPWPRFSCQAKVCQLDQLCAVTQQILWLQISVKETWETQQQTHVHRCTQRLLYLQISVKETSETQQQTHVHRCTQRLLYLQISVKETSETQQQTHVHRCTQRLLYLQISVKETSETQQQTHVHRCWLMCSRLRFLLWAREKTDFYITSTPSIIYRDWAFHCTVRFLLWAWEKTHFYIMSTPSVIYRDWAFHCTVTQCFIAVYMVAQICHTDLSRDQKTFNANVSVHLYITV